MLPSGEKMPTICSIVVDALRTTHALTAHLFGQPRHGRLDAVVHVDRREVRIGADLERHVDRQRAIAGVRPSVMYSMFSTPLISSSSGAATVSAIVSAVAPG